MKDAFKVKKGLNVQPTDPADVVNPEAGDIIVDSTDDNRLKVYDPTSSEFAAVGTGGSSGNILSDIEKLTPTVSNVVAVTDTTTFLPIDDNNKSVKATFSGSDGSIRYEAPASADLDGVQGAVYVWIKTDVENLTIVATKDGVAQNEGLEVNSSNKWRQYEIPVVLGDADYGFEIQASGAVSGDVYIDEAFVKVNRLIQQFDTTITDWKDYTPTVINGGSSTWSHLFGKYRQVGDSVELAVSAIASGAGSGGGLLCFTIPSQFTGNATKIAGTVGSGQEYNLDGVTNTWAAFATSYTSSNNCIFFQNVGTGGAYVGSHVTSSTQIYFKATVAVNELSTETSTIVTQDTELTAKTANEFSLTTIGGNVVSENYDWVVGNPTSSSNVYTYTIKPNIFTVNPSCTCTAGPFGGSTADYTCSVNTINTTTLAVNMTVNGGGVLTSHSIHCSKQGADVNKSATIVGKFENINSSDLVVVEAFGNTGIGITSLTTDVQWSSEKEDDYNAWNGTQFTSPRDSCYDINAGVRSTANTQSQLRLYINGSPNGVYKAPMASYIIKNYEFANVCLNKDDVLSFRSDSGYTLQPDTSYHRLVIQERPNTQSIIKNLSNQKVECQQKFLSSDISSASNAIISDLAFNNLVIGKRYRAYLRSRCNFPSSNACSVYIDDNGTSICRTTPSGSGGLSEAGFNICEFTASTTTLNTMAGFASASAIIQGSGDDLATNVRLCELPDTYVETTKF